MHVGIMSSTAFITCIQHYMYNTMHGCVAVMAGAGAAGAGLYIQYAIGRRYMYIFDFIQLYVYIFSLPVPSICIRIASFYLAS
jgi:hypothetical protein